MGTTFSAKTIFYSLSFRNYFFVKMSWLFKRDSVEIKKAPLRDAFEFYLFSLISFHTFPTSSSLGVNVFLPVSHPAGIA